MKKIIFCDSTLSKKHISPSISSDYIFKPAIKRGDLIKLLDSGLLPEEVIIVDGVFEQSTSISHKEIMHMSDLGVKVIGISSIGALRAAELKGYGMLGYGEIYSYYLRGVIDGDDEVAISYVKKNGEIKSTIPLVNLRKTIIEHNLSSNLIDICKKIFFKDRTWNTLKEKLPEYEFKVIKGNYIDLKRKDVVNYLLSKHVEEGGGIISTKPYTYFWKLDLIKYNNKSKIDFIINHIKQIKNVSLSASSGNDAFPKLSAYLSLNESQKIKMIKILNEMRGFQLTDKYCTKFMKSIIRDQGFKVASEFSMHLKSNNIEKKDLMTIFNLLYKLYVHALYHFKF